MNFNVVSLVATLNTPSGLIVNEGRGNAFVLPIELSVPADTSTPESLDVLLRLDAFPEDYAPKPVQLKGMPEDAAVSSISILTCETSGNHAASLMVVHDIESTVWVTKDAVGADLLRLGMLMFDRARSDWRRGGALTGTCWIAQEGSADPVALRYAIRREDAGTL